MTREYQGCYYFNWGLPYLEKAAGFQLTFDT